MHAPAPARLRGSGYFDADARSLDELAALVDTATDLSEAPHASEVVANVVVYDAAALRSASSGPGGRRAVLAELAHVLRDGPGVFAVRGAVDRDIVDRATSGFARLLADQRAAGGPTGDHFAAAGANDRIWNALEKLAVLDPDTFVDYYASDVIALACEAWLGPAYQVTSQINIVNPGGAAQSPHRDYHLGFMSDESAAVYPVHAHLLSPLLTLQGAIAHCDMPIESGPTKLLPHSQKYAPGYVVWRQPEVIDLFEQRCVQLPLAIGDAVFFNPAVYHAAGTNRTADVHRIANLLQVGSAFGRSTEAVDRARVVRSIYPALLRRQVEGWPTDAIDRVVAASAEGYAFPTNLDRDPPIGGLAPPSQAAVVRRAIDEAWTAERLDAELTAHDTRRRTA